MADPKITLKWADNNADETGHRILITSEPWNRGAPSTTIKDVAADLTSADLTLAEVTMEPAFLKVAALRGTEVKDSVESALAIKTPVATGPIVSDMFESILELPYGVVVPTLTKGVPASYPTTDRGFAPDKGFTVTPDGILLQIDNNAVLTLDPATGAMTSTPIPGSGISQINSGLCVASDGNVYLVGRYQGNPSLMRYKLDGEEPTVVYTWAYGTGPGYELSPSCVKQGVDGRLYLFGGYKFITADNKMVVNSVELDGSNPRTDVISVPAGFNTNTEICLMTAKGTIVVWVPGKDEILSYDPSGTPTVDVYTGNAALNTPADPVVVAPTTRRILAPFGKYSVFIMGRNLNVCRFQYENTVQPYWILPADFLAGKPVREMFESGMGWTFISNVHGGIFAAQTDGRVEGRVFTPEETGMAIDPEVSNYINGPSFVRIGKTVYAIATDGVTMRVCPFHLKSLWQSCNGLDAVGLLNTSGRGANV